MSMVMTHFWMANDPSYVFKRPCNPPAQCSCLLLLPKARRKTCYIAIVSVDKQSLHDCVWCCASLSGDGTAQAVGKSSFVAVGASNRWDDGFTRRLSTDVRKARDTTRTVSEVNIVGEGKVS